VQVDAWSAGYHGSAEDEEGHRLVRAVAYFRGDALTAYTRPIEGLVAIVDLTTRKVKVIDTGVVPLPREDARFCSPWRSPASALPSLEITQPQGSGFMHKGQEVNWANWQFRFAMHPREGLMLYTVGYRDHGKLRSILYRGSLSDMVVPYGDPGPTWYFRNVFDTGEYAFVGRSLMPLNRGVDVPGNATFYAAVFADEEGRAIQTSRAAALYVRDGGLLWRYSDLAQDGKVISRRVQELVLSWIITAGNYEYGFNWVFHEDGRLEMEVLLTGIMITKAVTPSTTHEQMHGHQVTESLEAVNHQHFFNFRLAWMSTARRATASSN
jgi:primary-amine oxidase